MAIHPEHFRTLWGRLKEVTEKEYDSVDDVQGDLHEVALVLIELLTLQRNEWEERQYDDRYNKHFAPSYREYSSHLINALGHCTRCGMANAPKNTIAVGHICRVPI